MFVTDIQKPLGLILCMGLLFVLAACSGADPQVIEVTRVVPQTVVVQEVVTPTAGEVPAAETATPEPSPTAPPTETPTPTNTVIPPTYAPWPTYYPLKGCAASRLRVGDRAMVTFGGGPNAIRYGSDTNPPYNIIGYAKEGEIVEIIGGPICNHGWVVWLVRTAEGLEGYTPEGDGITFWLQP